MNRREQVYEAIDRERDYQRRRWGDRVPAGEGFLERRKDVESYLLYMEEYLLAARREVTMVASDVEARRALLKAVTLGVACLEQHGVTDVQRQQPAGFVWDDPWITNARDRRTG